MQNSSAPLTHKMIRILIRPFVKMFIRHGHGFSEIVEALRGEYVDVAITSLKDQGYEINASRLSAVTGIGRREINKVLKSPISISNQATLTARVIGLWEHSLEYKTKNGIIKSLSVNGKNSDFFNLVESVSKDINPYTLLFELERKGAISKAKDGKVTLVKTEFIPSKQPDQSIELLSSDLNDFIVSVDENIYAEQKVPNLHLKTEYTNVKESSLSEIKKWLVNEGSAFHSRVRDFVSKYDIDVNPETFQQTGIDKDKAGIRVAVGTFSRIEQ